MPWARMHALKDYLDMVEILSDYPDLRQTFNLVPSLVEQLETYASGSFTDLYWEYSLRPTEDLASAERAFLLERMCERPDHPRAQAHTRYLELAHKREHHCSDGWDRCVETFSVQELRDLQVWFNLAWCDQRDLQTAPLSLLVEKDRDFSEDDKTILAEHQTSVLQRVLPAYRAALERGQVELSTSPYFHPILPLLCDTDSARVASPDIGLPPSRFSHPEDAAEHLALALAKHEQVFGTRARGVWCSEQAVGEDILPLLMQAGIAWTISDEGVLARSLSGTTPVRSGPPGESPYGSPYAAYKLARGAGETAIVFRDHMLSDLIGFTYKSWDSRDAAHDLLGRLRRIRERDEMPAQPLVVIALDGENAWEHYPNDGYDFLSFLYEGLRADDSLDCVTVSEHLQSSPPSMELDWLHTGSWIAADLRTWCGSRSQNLAWDALHQARDLVAHRRRPAHRAGASQLPARTNAKNDAVEAAWHEILVAQGSDWFWWFGDHHHTELDSVWDLEFRRHLQEAYKLLDLPIPDHLRAPFADTSSQERPALPSGPLAPSIDGVLSDAAEWEAAGYLAPDLTSCMQPAEAACIAEVRFGWQGDRLCLLVEAEPDSLHAGLEITAGLLSEETAERSLVRLTLAAEGGVTIDPAGTTLPMESVQAAWRDVLEISLALDPAALQADTHAVLAVRVGQTQVFHSAAGFLPAPETT